MECPFWLQVQKEVQQELGDDSDPELLKSFEIDCFKRDKSFFGNVVQASSLTLGSGWLHRIVSKNVVPRNDRAVKNSLVVYRAIRRVTKCPVIMESSKCPRRLKELYLADPEGFRLIFLVRDGRAVTASSMRRVGADMRSAAIEWERWNRRSQWAQWTIPNDQKMLVHYEDVCNSTEETLRKICEFIGLPFEGLNAAIEEARVSQPGRQPHAIPTGGVNYSAGRAMARPAHRGRPQGVR